MNAGQNIIRQHNRKIMAARDTAAADLISMSAKLDQMIDDKYIDGLVKYDLEDANHAIKKVIRRIKPIRSMDDLLGDRAR